MNARCSNTGKNRVEPPVGSSPLTRVCFWEGCAADLDLKALAQRAVPVKGVAFDDPTRFLEIFMETDVDNPLPTLPPLWSRRQLDDYLGSWHAIRRSFYPSIPGVNIQLGEELPQPPFRWGEAQPEHLAVSFTYNTNAFYRILSGLAARNQIPEAAVEPMLDWACFTLAWLYKTRGGFLLRSINNNFNMFLISKVVEFLLGKRCYNADEQELETSLWAMEEALKLIPAHQSLSVQEKMGVALGQGVSFIESRLRGDGLDTQGRDAVQQVAFRYYEDRLAIDHRAKLLTMIGDAGQRSGSFKLAVILDDAVETVNDLLWLLHLMLEFRFLKIHLLVNTAQISVNFSSKMLAAVLRHPAFHNLLELCGNQFQVTEMYCPFISFQTNFLPPEARQVIDNADAVYIKGANFFETCQVAEKDTFYAFVVYGPISRYYSGLSDFQGVFAHVPPGVEGYRHPTRRVPVRTLLETVGQIEANL